MRSSHVAIALGVCLIAAPRPAMAQVQRGAVSGIAHDKASAVLPGVVVTLTSELAAPRETTTAGRGEFRFSDLDPGAYSVRAELAGFAPLVRRDIIVGVGASVEITIEMVVADVLEDVVVTTASP